MNYSTDMRLAFNLGVCWRDNGGDDVGAAAAAPAEEAEADEGAGLLVGKGGQLDMERLVRAYKGGAELAPLPRTLAAFAAGA